MGPTKPPMPTTTAPSPSKQTSNGKAVELTSTPAKFVPPKILIHAVEGFGKTTIGAFAPKAAILMARGEPGYETLKGNGLVPVVPSATINHWNDLLATINGLADQDIKTLVLDAMDGFERLCHEFICTRDFKGDWGEKGFASYQKGYDVSIAEWLKLLQALEVLQRDGTMILMLDHSKVTTFKDPMGPDYDRYTTACHHKTWGATCKWASAVLFGKFDTITDKQNGREKGIGGTERVIYTQQTDAYVAKNQYKMPSEIKLPDDHTKAWNAIWEHVKPKK